MKCPICKKKEVALGDPDFPFCSERCRVIDREISNILTLVQLDKRHDPPGRRHK